MRSIIIIIALIIFSDLSVITSGIMSWIFWIFFTMDLVEWIFFRKNRRSIIEINLDMSKTNIKDE